MTLGVSVDHELLAYHLLHGHYLFDELGRIAQDVDTLAQGVDRYERTITRCDQDTPEPLTPLVHEAANDVWVARAHLGGVLSGLAEWNKIAVSLDETSAAALRTTSAASSHRTHPRNGGRPWSTQRHGWRDSRGEPYHTTDWWRRYVHRGAIVAADGLFALADALFLPSPWGSITKDGGSSSDAPTNSRSPGQYDDTATSGAEVITRAVFAAWKLLRLDQYNRFNTPIVQRVPAEQPRQRGFTDLRDILGRHRAARAAWRNLSTQPRTENATSAEPRRDGLITTDVVMAGDEPAGIVVTIPGTQGNEFLGADRSSTWLTNVQLIDKNQQVANLAAVREVIALTKAEAGLPVDSPIPLMIVGHSQGGVIAASLDADQHTTSRDNITHVFVAGSPVGHHELQASTKGLAWELSDDVVPHLDGADNNVARGFVTLRHRSRDADLTEPLIGPHRDTTYLDSFATENLTTREQLAVRDFTAGSPFIDAEATLQHREFHVRRQQWAS